MIDLRHFTTESFRGWGFVMSVRLLILLDAFRGQWGHPVIASPAKGAIGRHNGPDGTSQHNIDRWGEVRAIDIMPYNMNTEDDAREAVNKALGVGFTGVGIYPDWQPMPGMHVDVRTTRNADNPATWAGIDSPDGQIYVGLKQGYERFK